MIAGFDKNFNRPSFANFDLFLNNDGKIEWECNYFKENFDGVSIFTFAQDSEIKSYIEGIDEYFEEEILNYWGDMLDILLNDLFEEIKNNKFDKNIINDIKIKFESFKDKSESYKIMLGQEIDELKNKNNEYLRSII
ncbi:MAG: hypothetical protein IJ104_03840 [Methanobrevibacter sp.]|nr:hypothetical protein [Methanobrevibacter sp.]